jgi:hypothetical protein
MILLMVLTFLLTTARYSTLLWLGCRRESRHLQGNSDAVKAIIDHVLIPPLGRRLESESDPAPVGKPKLPSTWGTTALTTPPLGNPFTSGPVGAAEETAPPDRAGGAPL